MKNKLEEIAKYEPKRQNRFYVKFPEEINIESWFIQKINKPKYHITENKWENIQVTFLDPIGSSTSQRIHELIKNQFFINKETKPIFIFDIIAVDPTGLDVEDWEIGVEEVLYIDFGNLDYSIDEISEISMWVKPQYCTLKY